MEAQDQLQLERLENKRVNQYLDEIVQEVEAKAPILKRQREEYERVQKSVANLSAKLEQAMKVSGFLWYRGHLCYWPFLPRFWRNKV